MIKAAIFIGVVLLAIGLATTFYYESAAIYGYRDLGLVLDVVGAILIAGGFLYQPQQKPLQPSQPS